MMGIGHLAIIFLQRSAFYEGKVGTGCYVGYTKLFLTWTVEGFRIEEKIRRAEHCRSHVRRQASQRLPSSPQSGLKMLPPVMASMPTGKYEIIGKLDKKGWWQNVHEESCNVRFGYF